MIGAANFDSLTLNFSNPDASLLEKEHNWTNTKDGVINSKSKFTLTSLFTYHYLHQVFDYQDYHHHQFSSNFRTNRSKICISSLVPCYQEF